MTAISREAQLDFARTMCRHDKLAGAQFWCMVRKDRTLVPVIVPCGPDQNRDLDLLILQFITQRLQVVRAFQLMEAWVTISERQIGETDAEHRARSIAVPPRKSETRREAINLLDVRKDKPPVQVLQFIDRDEQGQPRFPEKPVVQRGTGLESGWAKVLNDPPPFPPGEVGDLMRAYVESRVQEITLQEGGDA